MVSWSSLSNVSTKWFLAAATGVAFGMWLVSHNRTKHRKRIEAKYEQVGTVSALILYPIKSCQGMEPKEAVVTRTGLKLGNLRDRHFLITLANGDFLSQRRIALMGAVQTAVEGKQLVLTSPTMKSPLRVPLRPIPDPSKVKSCRVWASNIDGHDLGEEASVWLSEVLKEEGVRLVTFMPGMAERGIRKGAPLPTDKIAYQNDGPLLVTTESSLADLVSKIPTSPENETITMNNFRPNIVITGTVPWDEDNWVAMKIGDKARLRTICPCNRCIQTTVDPDKHERRTDHEPMKTLHSFRMFPEISKTSPLFGVFAGVDVEADVKVGDPVYVLKK